MILLCVLLPCHDDALRFIPLNSINIRIYTFYTKKCAENTKMGSNHTPGQQEVYGTEETKNKRAEDSIQDRL